MGLQELTRSSSGNPGRRLQQAHSWGPVGRVRPHPSLRHQVSVYKVSWRHCRGQGAKWSCIYLFPTTVPSPRQDQHNHPDRRRGQSDLHGAHHARRWHKQVENQLVWVSAAVLRTWWRTKQPCAFSETSPSHCTTTTTTLPAQLPSTQAAAVSSALCCTAS